MPLENYSGFIQAGQNLVPDVSRQLAETSALSAQAQEMHARAAEATQKVFRAQQFQHDIASYDGSPAAAAHLIMRYPEYAEPLKQAYGIQDGEKRTADLRSMGEIYSAATGGNWKLAQRLAHERADAEKAAGHSDPGYDAALQVLDQAAAGDTDQQKVVKNMLGMSIASITGPDKFTETYGALTKDKGYTLAPGDMRFDENNQKVAAVDAKPDFLVVPEGGKAIPLNPAAAAVGGGTSATGGGGPASGAGQTPSPPVSGGGVKAAVAHVLSNEGGYNPKDMNGYPTNFGINAKANSDILNKMNIADLRTMTKDQAAQIYETKYWPQSGAANLPANMQAPYFDVYVRSPALAKKALAQSGGDPARFAQITNTAFQTMAAKNPNAAVYAHAWAARDAGNAAIATGQAQGAIPPHDRYYSASSSPVQPGDVPGTVYGNPKPQAATLTPAQTKALGLDIGKVYERHPDGTVSAVGDADSTDVLHQYGISENMTGPDVLTRLPGHIASQVKALAEGRLPMPSSFALAKPYWQHLLQITAQYDPTFDAATAPARKAAILAFTGNGKGAQIVGSINRVANHLQTLWNASNALAGPDVGWGPANTALAAAGQSFEPKAAAAYDTAVGFVAGELGKIAKAGVVTEGEVNRIISNLGRRQSSDTRKSAIKTAVDIISGAFDPLKSQYESAFANESARPNIPWVSSKAQSVFRQIGGADLSLTGSSANSNAPTQSSGRSPPAGATRTATGPNGQKAALVNGHWVVY